MTGTDARQHSLAAERNRQPILEVMQRWLPSRGRALEVASGTGQHGAHFAAGLSGWTWQPTERDATLLRSIAAWRAAGAPSNLLPPLALDVMASPWPIPGRVDAIFCANMLHIAPWAACVALMQGAGRHLKAGGALVVYGPFIIDGVDTAASNLAFDADLRARDASWGLRRLHEVEGIAAKAGLSLLEHASMPANNSMLLFTRAQPVVKPAPPRGG